MADDGRDSITRSGESPRDYSGFVKEEIKKRPVNRRRLVRRLFTTSLLAAVFGAVACAAFFLLQPVISNLLYPETPPQKVIFPEETRAEEMSPSEMLASDEADEPESYSSDVVGELGISAMEAASSLATVSGPDTAGADNAEEIAEDAAAETPPAPAGEEVPPEVSLEESGEKTASGKLYNALQREENVADYAAINSSLRTVVRRVNASLTRISAVSAARDWLSDPYETSGQLPGIIIADNGEELLILTRFAALHGAIRISVTFADGTEAEGTLKAGDRVSDLCVVAVDKHPLSRDTLDSVKVAGLGSSNAADLLGMPVIALGAPAGSIGSVIYGNVTGSESSLDIMAAHYRRLTTDIYCSAGAQGVLVNLSGQVVGITDMRFNTEDMPYVLSAMGITELKGLIEKLSNGERRACLGIHGVDVPAAMVRDGSRPAGAFVVRTGMDSPAMEAGIMSGDIITGITTSGGEVISVTSLRDYVGTLLSCAPGDEIGITLRRAGASEEYAELTVTAVLAAGDEFLE